MIAAAAGVALQIAITVTAPETLTVRQPATIVVRAMAAGSEAPTIRPPRFAPLRGMRVETSTQVNRTSVAGSVRVEHRYLVVSERPGTFTLAPFEASVGRSVNRSEPIRLTVIADAPVAVPAVVSRARLDPRAGVNFHAMVVPDTVYVGEQATYQVGVFLNDDVRYRLRRNPEFIPPELRSMLAYDLSAPRSFVSRRVIDGRRYEVHVFQRALFPLSAGRYEIPPAKLNYSLPLSASFFSREESHQLRSAAVPLVVVEPPESGRPPDYRGAVGRLSLEAALDTGGAKVGDPLVLTVRVTGDGNVSFFPRPELRVAWGQLVPAEERVHLDSSATLVRGTKEFDWVITPARSGDVEVPEIRYPYFNPYTERYELAVTSPHRLSVAPGTIVATDAAADSAHAALPIRRALRAPASAPMSSSPLYWLAILATPLPALILLLARRPRTRPVPTAGERLRQIARAREPGAIPDLRRAYAAALAERIGINANELSDRRALVRALRRSGVTSEVAHRADTLLGELDAAVYSGHPGAVGDRARRADEVLRQVDEEAKPRIIRPGVARRPSARSSAFAFAVMAFGGTQIDPAAREAFDRGVREYEARRYARAERFFADAARLEPASADAWANFGTAAWAAGDTAAAAVGWQRALRLDPIAGDVRANLDLTPGYGGFGLTAVPPVAESYAAIAGGLLWVAAWGLAAFALWKRRTPLRHAAYGLGAAALVIGVVGIRAHVAHEARGLGVVVEGTRLRGLPALGAEPGAPVLTGELARTVREQGVWSLVRLTDDRQGWLETERLESIGVH